RRGPVRLDAGSRGRSLRPRRARHRRRALRALAGRRRRHGAAGGAPPPRRRGGPGGRRGEARAGGGGRGGPAGTPPRDRGAPGAAGLTQILAETGTALLGMHIDVARSASYTRRIANSTSARHTAALERARARVDDRFDPAKALAATARYLTIAKQKFGREDL